MSGSAAVERGVLGDRLADCRASTKLVYVILREGGPLRQRALAKRAYLSEYTVTCALDELENRLGDDFVRRPDPADLRARLCNVGSEA